MQHDFSVQGASLSVKLSGNKLSFTAKNLHYLDEVQDIRLIVVDSNGSELILSISGKSSSFIQDFTLAQSPSYAKIHIEYTQAGNHLSFTKSFPLDASFSEPNPPTLAKSRSSDDAEPAIQGIAVRLSRYRSTFIIFTAALILIGSFLYQHNYALANYLAEAAYIILFIGILNELAGKDNGLRVIARMLKASRNPSQTRR